MSGGCGKAITLQITNVGENCTDTFMTVVDNGDGSYTATNVDGTIVTWTEGDTDTDTFVTVVDNGDGTYTATNVDNSIVTWTSNINNCDNVTDDTANSTDVALLCDGAGGFILRSIPQVVADCAGSTLSVDGRTVGIGQSGTAVAWNLINALGFTGASTEDDSFILFGPQDITIPDLGCGVLSVGINHFYQSHSLISTGALIVVSEISFDGGVTWEPAGSAGAAHGENAVFHDNHTTGYRNRGLAPGTYALMMRVRLDNIVGSPTVADEVTFNQGRIQFNWPEICCGA